MLLVPTLVAPPDGMGRSPHAVWHAAAEHSSPPRVAGSGRVRSGDGMHHAHHAHHAEHSAMHTLCYLSMLPHCVTSA